MSLFQATGVRPYYTRGESHASTEFGIVFNHPSIIELIDPVQGQIKPHGQVMIESQRTVRLEQSREEPHAVAKARLIVVLVPDNAFIPLASYI